jgi:hypothetical protein
MHPVLADIIERFRRAQDRGVEAIVEVLGPALGVRLPASNREWVSLCAECGLYNVRWVNGIQIYAHGYGIELVLEDVTIDFDWGAAGEPDGFDAWRLWNFVSVNKLDVACEGHLQMQSWLQQAHQCGVLTQEGLYGLYYSPAHRAPMRERSKAGSDGTV